MSLNTTIRFTNDKKGKINRAIITGAWLGYVQLQKARPVWEQRELGNRATKTEWTADLIVTEETADAYDEVFTKQSSTKISKAEFKKRYKIEDDADLPDPKAKKFFMIKVKHSAQDKEGNPVDDRLRPRVVEMDANGEPVDITFEKLVGNGSKGDVLLRVASNDFGTFSYLSKLKVTDLIEYEGGGRDEVEEEFLGGTLKLAETDSVADEETDGFEDAEEPVDEDEEY